MNILSAKTPNALSRGLRLCLLLGCLSLVAACGDSPPPDGGDTGGDTGGSSGSGSGGGSGGGNTSCSASSSTPCPPPCPPDLTGIDSQYSDALARADAELLTSLTNASDYRKTAQQQITDAKAKAHAENYSKYQMGLISESEFHDRGNDIDYDANVNWNLVNDEYNRMNNDAKTQAEKQKSDAAKKRDEDIAAYQAFCAGSSQSSSGSNSMTPVTDQNHTIGMCDPSKGVCSPI